MTIKRGLHIGTDGLIETVDIDTGDHYGLLQYYNLIGTDTVERTQATAAGGRRFEIWCDENGYMHRAAWNAIVEDVFDIVVVGDVVVHGRSLDRLIAAMQEVGYIIVENGVAL